MRTKIIGFVGLRRSGKDTAADILRKERDYELVKFAGALKAMLRTYFEYVRIPPIMIERLIEGDMKEQPIAELGGKTCRWAMQSLGTEWGRNLISDNLWVESAMMHAGGFERVVISDCRFPNEAKAIEARGGKIIRIEREGITVDSHPSETLIGSIPADYVIHNKGTIADLHQSVLQLESTL